MIRYYITDRNAAGGRQAVLNVLARGGFDYVQIREKDLCARELLHFVEQAVAIAHPRGIRVLVNDRADIACAAGADGVHLPSGAVAPQKLRGLLRRPSLIAVSCHSVADVIAAEREGADFVVLGPVFDTPSKREYGPPLGLDVLRAACSSVSIPVLALGGVTAENTNDCIQAGATGVAGITLFQVQSERSRSR